MNASLGKVAALKAAGFALLRRLDTEADEDEWLDLFEQVTEVSRRLPMLDGYGLLDAEEGLMLACTTEEQARKVQMVLLLGGVVSSVTERGRYLLVDFCHPESAPEALTVRLLEAIDEENAEYDDEAECDCDECLCGDDDSDDYCECDGAGCDECRSYDASLDALLKGDDCVCPCARCKAGDHDNCTGFPVPQPTQRPPSKKYLN